MIGRAAALALLLLSACAPNPSGPGADADDGPRTTLQVRTVDGRLAHSIVLAPQAATPPVLAGDVVFVTTGLGVTAFGLDDGRPRWKLDGPFLPSAVLGDVAVFEHEGWVDARRLATGVVVWSRVTTGVVVQARESTGIVLVVDHAHPASAACGSQATPCRVLPPPRVGGSEPPAGATVSVLDPATGRDVWSVDVPARPDPSASVVGSRHVLGAFASPRGNTDLLVAWDLRTGKQAWRLSSPLVRATVEQDVVAVLSSDDPRPDRVRVLDGATGRQLWESTSPGFSRTAPFLDGTPGREGYRRDPRTGRELPGRVPFGYGPAAYDELLVGAGHRTLTGLRSGEPVWTAELPAGVRPITHLDVDARYVVSITSVGQPEYRD